MKIFSAIIISSENEFKFHQIFTNEEELTQALIKKYVELVNHHRGYIFDKKREKKDDDEFKKEYHVKGCIMNNALTQYYRDRKSLDSYCTPRTVAYYIDTMFSDDMFLIEGTKNSYRYNVWIKNYEDKSIQTS